MNKTARKKQIRKDIEQSGPASIVWKNRIVGYGEEPSDQLLANEKNWRIHPKNQQDALKDSLSKVGIVQNVIVNRRSGKMIDGHLRAQMAISENQPSVPITYVDLSDEEEALILATIDPVTGMAGTDQELLDSLITDIRLSDLGMDLGLGLNDLLNSLSPDPSLAAREGEDASRSCRASRCRGWAICGCWASIACFAPTAPIHRRSRAYFNPRSR